MKKRIIYVFTFLIFLLFSATLKLYRIQTNQVYKEKAEEQQKSSVVLSQSRGMIYDCNLKNLVNFTEKKSYFFSDRIFEFISTERYDSLNTASHIIGYTDSNMSGVYGIEKAFDDELKKYSGEILLNYYVTARGDVLDHKKMNVSEKDYLSSGGVVLTIDKKLQEISDRALKKNAQNGAVVILEIKTGALRAVSSFPQINRNNLAESLKNESKPFLNRAFSSYNVGSVFKLVVSAAAMEEGLGDFEYFCNGSCRCGGKTFSCFESKSHGLMNMESAIEKSCNTYFVKLSEKLSPERLIFYSKKFGFSQSSYYADGLYSSAGKLPGTQSLSSKSEMGAFCFGQSNLLATPIQIAETISTIANGGTRVPGYLVDCLIDEKMRKYSVNKRGNEYRVISAETASVLCKYMKNVSEKGTGKSGMPSGVEGGSKTATAETGIMKNGKAVLQTWYAGFVDGINPKYAVAVIIEDGTSGSTTAAPVFYDVVSGMKKNGYIKE